MKQPFWETKTLAEMSRDEWESLCDGCGHCCLVKLEDEDSAELYMTNMSCRLLDLQTCRCRDYKNRLEKVDMCMQLTPENLGTIKWLPGHCAYRLLSEGHKLKSWHPLISDEPEAMHKAGISVRSFAQSEEFIHADQLLEHIIGRLAD